MSMRSSLRCAIVAVAVAVSVGCQSLPHSKPDRLPTVVSVVDGSADRAALNARVYDAVIDKVTANFYRADYGGIDWGGEAASRRATAVAQPDEARFYRALNETLALLGDGHTSALPPAANLRRIAARVQATPSFGFWLTRLDETWIVTRVLESGPAALAGVEVGWRVDAVDGQPFNPGTLGVLETTRIRFSDAADGVHEVTLTPTLLSRELGRVRRRPDGVLVITFREFDRATRDWLGQMLMTELVDPPRAVVIDLRDNIGGVDREVSLMLSPFFGERRMIGIKDFRWLPDRHLWTRRQALRFDGPLAVLTSPASASGAEIFAAAIQETGRGPVVGRTTAGAVVGSLTYDLPDGGKLSVGVVGYRTGAGNILEQVGVVPDIRVTASLADLRAGRDPALEAAVRAILPDVSP